jgi:hypothetical protein
LFLKTEKISIILLLLVCSPPLGAGERPRNASVVRRADSSEAELMRARNEVLQKMRETREGAEKLLALHESARQRSEAEYERRREFYYRGLISRNEVLQAEDLLMEAISRVEEDKRWLAESDMALTEFTMRDELLRLPRLSAGGYSATGSLITFNGATGNRKIFPQHFWSRPTDQRLGSDRDARAPAVQSPQRHGCGASSRQQRRAVFAELSSASGDSLHCVQKRCSRRGNWRSYSHWEAIAARLVSGELYSG